MSPERYLHYTLWRSPLSRAPPSLEGPKRAHWNPNFSTQKRDPCQKVGSSTVQKTFFSLFFWINGPRVDPVQGARTLPTFIPPSTFHLGPWTMGLRPTTGDRSTSSTSSLSSPCRKRARRPHWRRKDACDCHSPRLMSPCTSSDFMRPSRFPLRSGAFRPCPCAAGNPRSDSRANDADRRCLSATSTREAFSEGEHPSS